MSEQNMDNTQTQNGFNEGTNQLGSAVRTAKGVSNTAKKVGSSKVAKKVGSAVKSGFKKALHALLKNPGAMTAAIVFSIGFVCMFVIICLTPIGTMMMADNNNSKFQNILSMVGCRYDWAKKLIPSICNPELYYLQRSEDAVYEIVKDGYLNVVESAKENVAETLNEDERFGCSFDVNKLKNKTVEDGAYYYDGDEYDTLTPESTCMVNIKFTPDVNDITSKNGVKFFIPSITSYVNSVDAEILAIADRESVKENPKNYGDYYEHNDEEETNTSTDGEETSTAEDAESSSDQPSELEKKIYGDEDAYGANVDGKAYKKKLEELLMDKSDSNNIFFTLDAKLYLDSMNDHNPELYKEEVIDFTWYDYYDQSIGDYVNGEKPSYYSLDNITMEETPEYRVYSAPITVKRIDLTVPILYDVRHYRELTDTLNSNNPIASIQDMAEKYIEKDPELGIDDVYSKIDSQLNSRYDIYMSMLEDASKDKDENNTPVYPDDYYNDDTKIAFDNYKDTLFERYGIIFNSYGVDSTLYEADATSNIVIAELFASVGNTLAGYDITGAFASLSSEESRKVWRQVYAITGVSDSTYGPQCVNFVRARVIETFGSDKIDSAPGNGRYVVDNLVNNHSDFWQKQTVPAANSVFSKVSGTYGHTGWINDVYQDENGVWRVVFSDGNTGGRQLVRVNCDVSLEEFNSYFGYSLVYAVPKS